MRVVADSTRLATAPGGSVELNLDIVNTSEVIDGVTARIIGLDPEQVTAHPALLPLFPDATGKLTLSVGVPLTFPAGRHPLTVEVASSVESERREHVDLDLVVEPRPALRVSLSPAVRRAHRRARFHVECRNDGNVPLATTLTATDPDRLIRCDFADKQLTVEPGSATSTMLTLRAKRRLFGNDLNRPVTVNAEAADQQVSDEVVATFRQRPLIARGLLTVVVLVLILGAWAGAFLVGLTKVFAGDPLTKSAPASFFVSSGANKGLRAAVTPTGTLAKSGTLPPGVGGGIGGTVTAASTGTGIGRIVVEALRQGRHGLVLEASAATQTDGSYSLLGLLPGPYYLRFSAVGYTTSWYPSAASQAKARQVNTSPEALTNNVNSTVTGLPASFSGSVDPGETLKHPHTVVTVRALQGPASAKPLAKTTTDANENYRLKNLPAPGSYELSYQTPGYAPTTVIDKVAGGEARSEPTVRLSAGPGSIAGVVTSDGKTPLGGVALATSQGGQQYATTTPTVGSKGHFSLTGLPTPGTYVLSFTRAGYGARTEVVDLAPGQQRQHLAVRLLSGTGTVSGTLTDNSGAGVGGATVTVGGGKAPITTTTLTNGAVGTYAVSGLPTPGIYTVTFSMAGYASVTVPVNLDDTHPTGQANATIAPGVGTITGRVVDGSGQPVVGAAVSVTDGLTVHTTVTVTGAGNANGSYTVSGLPPGTYSVTVSQNGSQQQTAIVKVLAAQPSCQNLQLVKPGQTAQAPPVCASM